MLVVANKRTHTSSTFYMFAANCFIMLLGPDTRHFFYSACQEGKDVTLMSNGKCPPSAPIIVPAHAVCGVFNSLAVLGTVDGRFVVHICIIKFVPRIACE